ncbi:MULTISPECIES: hypothetical protein [Gordonia]|uniref:Uncharacterized protein n=1 Tax=Gordonia sihwensis NBRC 108236 TaxID=1223544 RepID=L7LNU7_9ACTN|nr:MULTISPECIES: hypothetical protein [Gordonia]GAC62396.1 hypothetical protein GSI01S_34_00080 [Gordonia sihwensis NBRC 108236]
MAQRIPAKSPGDLVELREDLIARCHLVRERGWGSFIAAWSTGYVVVVAYLLRDTHVMDDLGEDAESVCARWAFDLFGFVGGEADRPNGWGRTAAWLAETQAAI